MRVIRGQDLKYVPASHESPTAPGVLKKVLFKAEDLIPGPVQMVNWALLPKGSSFRAHFHEDMQEIFVIIKGIARITVGDLSASLHSGDAVLVPPLAVHTMHNEGESDVEYLVVGISQGKDGKTKVVR